MVGGVVVGLIAFWVTSWLPQPVYLGPLCATRTVQDAGFDPWTGLGYGRLYECVRDNNGVALPTQLVRDPAVRTMFGTRHAIPIPIGIAAGCIAVAVASGIREYLRRRSQP